MTIVEVLKLTGHDIGTLRPGAEVMDEVRHHLVLSCSMFRLIVEMEDIRLLISLVC